MVNKDTKITILMVIEVIPEKNDQLHHFVASIYSKVEFKIMK